MNCQEALEQLQELMDGTLDQARVEQIRAHLAACQHCAQEWAGQQEIRSLVRGFLAQPEVPASLKSRVQELLTTPPRPSFTERLRAFFSPAAPWAVAGAAIILALVVPAAWRIWRPVEAGPPRVVIESVNDYMRFSLRNNPVEVSGDDVPRLIAWFRAQVNLSLQPPDLTASGTRLVGGGLSYFLERKVACLIYRRDARLVAIFVLRREGVDMPRGGMQTVEVEGRPMYLTQHGGYSTLLWEKNDFVYSLVTDMDRAEVLRVAGSMRGT